jgi:hypothetical protein
MNLLHTPDLLPKGRYLRFIPRNCQLKLAETLDCRGNDDSQENDDDYYDAQQNVVGYEYEKLVSHCDHL